MRLEKMLNFYRNGSPALSLGNEPLPIVKAKMWYFWVKLGRVNYPAAAAGPEGLPPGHEPFSPSWRTLRAGSRGGAWLGESCGALFLTR